jgi:hypothetical protein
MVFDFLTLGGQFMNTVQWHITPLTQSPSTDLPFLYATPSPTLG